jgi:hypothetical protein
MTTQNFTQERYTFTNLAMGNYTYPNANGTDGDGWDNIAFRIRIVAGSADDTVMVTVASDDGVTMTFVWDETRGLYDWITGGYGVVSVLANNAIVTGRLVALNHNAKKWRVNVGVDYKGLGAVSNAGIIEIRKVKV